ncbi:MAG: Hsp20/alpha crystallin family protein [Desulfobacterales bacterium]
MTDAKQTELQVKGKKEVASPAEQTTPGMVFAPDVDIFESEKEITLLADIPGVKPENLNIDLRENTLTIEGKVEPFESENEEKVFTEYEVGTYHRQFSISHIIDQGKINAELKDGVLRLILPKTEKAAPKKISVKS